MSMSRRTLYILVSIVILALVGAFSVGCTCGPGVGGRMPPTCQYWYDQGKSDGYQEGYDKGEDDGYEDGYDDGEDDGYRDGETAGYQKGYNEGLAAGRNQCPQCEDRTVPVPYPYPDSGSYQRGYNDGCTACKQQACTTCVNNCVCPGTWPPCPF